MKVIEIVVDNRVRVPVPLRSEVGAALAAEFTHENPDLERWKSLRFGAKPPKTIDTWRSERRGLALSFPRGGFPRVTKILAAHGFETRTVDRTVFPTGSLLEMDREPWPHQRDLIDAGLANYACLWRAPQGSGKTEAALGLIARIPTLALVVVGNSKLFDQWERRTYQAFGFKPNVIQGNRREVGRITVAMQQTLRNCAPEFGRSFGLVVVDESQCCASDTIQFSIDEFHSRHRIGISGDERRADRKEFLTYDQFGEVAHEVARWELEKSGEIVDVQVRIVLTDFRAPWYDDLRPSDDANPEEIRRAIRKLVLARERLVAELSEDDERNALVGSLLRLEQRHQVLVLVERVEHCLRLVGQFTAAGVKTGTLVGGKGHEVDFDISLADFAAQRARAAVGTFKAIGVGFESHRELAVGVIASPCVSNAKSRMQFNQYRGRFARSAPGKKRGILYYLLDRQVFGVTPIKLIAGWNKDTVVMVEDADGGIQGIPAKQWLKELRKKR